jgi:putative ABC transport system permease protein
MTATPLPISRTAPPARGLLRTPLLLLVLFYQSLLLAISQIWSNKMRSVLTTIGIVIGVASVTAVIAALTGMKTSVLKEFENLGTNKVFVFPRRPDTGKLRNASFREILLKPDEFDDLLKYCPSVKAFTRETNMSRDVFAGQYRVQDVDVNGIDPSWHDIERRQVTLGRPFSLIDNEQSRAVCLINPTLRDKLGLARDPSGESIMIGDRRYLVIGVVEELPSSSLFRGQSGGAETFIPFNLAYQIQSSAGVNRLPFMHVVAAARTTDASEEAKAEIDFLLKKRRHIGTGEEPTFRVEYVASFVEQFNALASAVTMIAGGIVGISLLVGGVGIMNIMLVSVSERTREIGLRKAVGARPAAILLQFLVEAVMLCFIGGLVGVMIGEVLTKLLASIPQARLDSAYIPAWAIAMSFGFAAAVGLIFGMFPAIKAARLDPIDALRHE